MKKNSALLTIVLAVSLALLVLTVSIAAPLVWRGFYRLHIDPLGLAENTRWSREEIVAAYDGMLDFCMGKAEELDLGVFRFTPEGRDHFVDTRALFMLDFRIMALSLAAAVIVLAVSRVGKIGFSPLLGRGPLFWAGAGLGGGFLLVGALASIDFDVTFTVFHKLFFPGKENWIFDYRTDEIINVLPQEFFRNCAILILALMLTLCAALIIADRAIRRRNAR